LKTSDETKHEALRQKLVAKELELEEVERLTLVYELSRNYLDHQDISTFRNAFDVNKFVLGMIENFKI
jgi:hypothetical protein